MADDLGITIGSYSAIENGKVKITLERLQHIADILQTPMIALLPEDVLFYTVNASHGTHAINAATYINYQNKEMVEAMQTALQFIQMVATKMKG